MTDGRGVDLVVDPVGGKTLEGSIERWRIEVESAGSGSAGRDERPPEVWPLMQKNGSLTGVFLGAEMVVNNDRCHGMIHSLIRRRASASSRSSIDRTFPLADAAEAHRYIESRRAFGRVLLIP